MRECRGERAEPKRILRTGTADAFHAMTDLHQSFTLTTDHANRQHSLARLLPHVFPVWVCVALGSGVSTHRDQHHGATSHAGLLWVCRPRIQSRDFGLRPAGLADGTSARGHIGLAGQHRTTAKTRNTIDGLVFALLCFARPCYGC